MTSTVADDVTNFIAREAGVPSSSVTRNTRLWHDLRIGGDDVDEVLSRFSNRFNVDVSGLSLAGHFPSEPAVWCVSAWEYVAKHVRFVRPPRYADLTVDDFIRAAEAHAWHLRQ